MDTLRNKRDTLIQEKKWQEALASASDDQTVKLWEVFRSCPYPRNKPLPPWAREFLPPGTTEMSQYPPSQFDITLTIPGWLIEQALATRPQEFTQYLFGLQTTETFSTESFAMPQYIW